jgi:hypothetical protein
MFCATYHAVRQEKMGSLEGALKFDKNALKGEDSQTN